MHSRAIQHKQAPYTASLSKSGNGRNVNIIILCARGRKTLQTYGFPIQGLINEVTMYGACARTRRSKSGGGLGYGISSYLVGESVRI